MQSYDEIAMQSLDFADLNPPLQTFSTNLHDSQKRSNFTPGQRKSANSRKNHIPVLKYIQSNDQPGTKLSSFAVVTNWAPSNKTFSNPT